MALSFNCAWSLVLREEEGCDFTVAAGKVSASVLPGISGFLSSFLGVCLASRGSLKCWFAKNLVCCVHVVCLAPGLAAPCRLLMQ